MMAAGASAENFGHSARKSGGGRTVSRRRSSCGHWMVYDIVQGQENQLMSYRSRKIGIQQKCSGRRWIYVQLGRHFYNKNFLRLQQEQEQQFLRLQQEQEQQFSRLQQEQEQEFLRLQQEQEQQRLQQELQ